MLIIILHYLDESNLITRVLIRGPSYKRVLIRQEEQSQRENLEDVALLALKVEEGTTSQGCQVASGSWKRHGSRFSRRACSGNTALLMC